MARMYIEQIEQEFSDLIHSYHIGSPRSEGIWLKVTGVKDAISVIEKETKVVEQPKIIKPPVVPSKPVIPVTPPPPVVTSPPDTKLKKK